MVGGRPVMEAPPPMEEEVECISLSFLHCLCIGLFGIVFDVVIIIVFLE